MDKFERRAQQRQKERYGPKGSMTAQHKRMEVNKNYAGVPKALMDEAIQKITITEKKKKR